MKQKTKIFSMKKQSMAMSLILACGSLFAANTPNIILINLDDAGYGDFPQNKRGGYETPHIDQMAAQGMKFTQFLAVQAVSGASRAGLLTGMYPNRIGMGGAPFPNASHGIHPDEMTMGELMKQKGYATAVYGKWHLGDHKQFLPLQNGFDEWHGVPYSHDMWPFHPHIHNMPDIPNYKNNEIVEYNTDPSTFITDYTKEAIEFIGENAKKNKAFFIYFANPMPHVPLAVSDKFKGKSEQGLYGDVMMEIDWSVNEILKSLKTYQIEENTLVILTSDNGPWLSYGNHAGVTGGLREGKGTSFEGGNRVPCIMYWKGVIQAGSVCDRLATNIDLFPTMAEISQAPLPEHKLDGVSLVPLLKGEKDANPRTEFAYYYNGNDLEAVTDGCFKLRFPHSHRSYLNQVPGKDGRQGKQVKGTITEMEIYDLNADPAEEYNVIAQYPEKLEELRAMGERYREDIGDGLTKKAGKNRRKPGFVRDYKVEGE